MLKMVGYGPAGLAILNTDTGDVFVGTDSKVSGLGAFNWDKFGNIFTDAWKPIAEGLKNKLSGPAYAGAGLPRPAIASDPYAGVGAQASFGPSGAQGTIDSNTIIMFAAIGLGLFLLIRKR